MKNKIILIAVTMIVLIGAFVIGVSMYKKNEQKTAENIAREEFLRLVPDYAPKMGPDNPEVYLVEFLDPECETCREFYPFVKSILDEHPGKIQLVIRYAPFHPNSKFAIKILEAARKQNKYWETLEVLFRYQPEWGSHHHPQPELIWKYLPEAGVDVEQAKLDFNDPGTDEMLAREMADVQHLNVRGTPQFFANGRPLENFGYEQLRELVESSLKK